MIIRKRKADFDNLLSVLKREKTDYPVLFEIYMDEEFYEYFSEKSLKNKDELEKLKIVVEAFYNAGYVYATTLASEFEFKTAEHTTKLSRSLNECALISDWDSFYQYKWNDPEDYDYSKLEKIKQYLPDNMKIVIMSRGGVLENVTSLIGYDNMCYMLFDEPELLSRVFDEVGSRLLKYYKLALQYDSVGAIICNDDWGFNSQTFLSIPDLKKYVFPWHKKMVDLGHDNGRPVILHSCGYMNDIMDYIIEDLGYDAKHSFEDNIYSVEKSIQQWGNRIAILGGLDLNFLINSSESEIVQRSKKLLDRTMPMGGYALGSGNSLAHYLPHDKVVGMLKTAIDY